MSPTRASRASASACTTSSRPPAAARPRKRVGRGEGSGTGKTVGPRPEGLRLALGRQGPRALRGRPDPIHMRMRKLRGPHMKKSMPFEPFRTHTQPVNLDDLEARFDAGAEVRSRRCARRAWRTRKDIPVKILGQGRADQAADRPRPRLQRRRPRARSRPPAAPASVVEPSQASAPPMSRTILSAFTVAEIRKKLAFTAALLALYRLGSHIPVPGRQHPGRRRRSRSNSAAAASSSLLNTVHAAAGCRGSRSSRWGSCPTSRPRSSCSC